jgi:hypothetical protein
MSLDLIPPGVRVKTKNGKRYANPFFLYRHRVDGKLVEVSTGTADPEQAQIRALEMELELRKGDCPPAETDLTFREAAALYKAHRSPSDADIARIDLILTDPIADKTVRAIAVADFVACADRLKPGLKASTKNRNVMRMAIAIHHHAADGRYCGWLRVKTFKEPPAKTRAVDVDTARALIAAVPTATSAGAQPSASSPATPIRCAKGACCCSGCSARDPGSRTRSPCVGSISI